MQTKKCSKCGKELPISDFHADKRKKYGVGCACRECKNKYKHDNREKLLVAQKERRKRKAKELAPKQRAWNAIYYAHRTGKIKKPAVCEICGSNENIQGHHNNYSKLFDVVWCCQKCHVNLDKKRRIA